MSTPCRDQETDKCDTDMCGPEACRFVPDKAKAEVTK